MIFVSIKKNCFNLKKSIEKMYINNTESIKELEKIVDLLISKK
jgi:hypothetical protein